MVSKIPHMVIKYGLRILIEMGFQFITTDDTEFEILEFGLTTPQVVETFWYLREATGKGNLGWKELDKALRQTFLICAGEDSAFDGCYGKSD